MYKSAMVQNTTQNTPSKKLILALPKGRILEEVMPFLKACDLIPEDDFYDKSSRALRFSTNHDHIDIIRVRSFDVATFVAYGGAHFGVIGSDVLEEFNYDGLYAPLDLGIGQCRLSIAAPISEAKSINLSQLSHIEIATKYPNITARYFARRGIQAECIKLNGAMEIAPALNLSRLIVDLVSTGSTLKANNLTEIETILNVSSKLVVNRAAFKTRGTELSVWVEKFRACVS